MTLRITYDDKQEYCYLLLKDDGMWCKNLSDNTNGRIQFSEFRKAAKKLKVEYFSDIITDMSESTPYYQIEKVFNTVEETEQYMRGELLSRFQYYLGRTEDEGFTDDDE